MNVNVERATVRAVGGDDGRVLYLGSGDRNKPESGNENESESEGEDECERELLKVTRIDQNVRVSSLGLQRLGLELVLVRQGPARSAVTYACYFASARSPNRYCQVRAYQGIGGLEAIPRDPDSSQSQGRNERSYCGNRRLQRLGLLLHPRLLPSHQRQNNSPRFQSSFSKPRLGVFVCILGFSTGTVPSVKYCRERKIQPHQTKKPPLLDVPDPQGFSQVSEPNPIQSSPASPAIDY